MPATETLLKDMQVAYVEAYTPQSAQVESTYLAKDLEYAFFQTSEDATVSAIFYGGNTQDVIVKGGVPYPYAVKQITAVSAGIIYILHNGK